LSRNRINRRLKVLQHIPDLDKKKGEDQMKAFMITVACLTFAELLPIPSFSAPMMPWNPLTIEGTIEEVTWVPTETVKGIPGWSGSAAHDRTFPAHYKVILANIIVPKKTKAFDPPSYKSGDTVTIKLNHDKDDGYLKSGMRIKVVDYKESGDEGGEWTYFKSVEILSQGE
jgi:hypothetical protein